jgi:hypothetical protein
MSVLHRKKEKELTDVRPTSVVPVDLPAAHEIEGLEPGVVIKHHGVWHQATHGRNKQLKWTMLGPTKKIKPLDSYVDFGNGLKLQEGQIVKPELVSNRKSSLSKKGAAAAAVTLLDDSDELPLSGPASSSATTTTTKSLAQPDSTKPSHHVTTTTTATTPSVSTLLSKDKSKSYLSNADPRYPFASYPILYSVRCKHPMTRHTSAICIDAGDCPDNVIVQNTETGAWFQPLRNSSGVSYWKLVSPPRVDPKSSQAVVSGYLEASMDKVANETMFFLVQSI